MANGEDVQELVEAIEQLVDRDDAAISIRSAEGKFLYVNRAWENNFDMTSKRVLGKTLAELDIVSASEVAESEAIDNVLKQKKSVVETVTYGPYNKIVVIRAFLLFKKDRYRIVVAFNAAGGGYVVKTPLGWDPARADRVFGELIALRLRLLESTSQIS